jgi:hypothetical protein
MTPCRQMRVAPCLGKETPPEVPFTSLDTKSLWSGSGSSRPNPAIRLRIPPIH